jgi:hypothetical protein
MLLLIILSLSLSALVSLVEERDGVYARMEAALVAKRKCVSEGKEEPRYVRPLFSVEEMKRRSEHCCNCCRSTCCEEAKQDDALGEGDDDVTMAVGVQRELDEVEKRLANVLVDTGCSTSTLGHEIYEEMTGYVVFRSVAGRSIAVQSLLTTPWESYESKDDERRRNGAGGGFDEENFFFENEKGLGEFLFFLLFLYYL